MALHNFERVYPLDLQEGAAGVFYLRSPFDGTKKIRELWIWLGQPLTDGVLTFNLRINGVAKFSGGDKPVISSAIGTGNVTSKTALDFDVAKGESVSVDLETVSKRAGKAPIVILVRFDDLEIGLPDQTSQAGKFLTTDGTNAAWDEVPILELPTFEAGKVLSNDGDDLIWTDQELGLPNQSGNDGKLLSTDGTNAEWIDAPDEADLSSIVDGDGALLSNGSKVAHFDSDTGTQTFGSDETSAINFIGGTLITFSGQTVSFLDASTGKIIASFTLSNGMQLSNSTTTVDVGFKRTATGRARVTDASTGAGSLEVSGFMPKYVTKSADYTLTTLDFGVGFTTSAARTATLPATPVDGQLVWILDESGGGAANNITIARNGKTIKGASSNLTINTAFGYVGLHYSAAAGNWSVIAQTVSSGGGYSLPSQTGNSGKFLGTNGTAESWTSLPFEMCVAVSDEITSITTGTGKMTVRAPVAFNLISVKSSLSTASSSGLPTVNIKKNGTTIFTTNLSINASAKTSVGATTAAVLAASPTAFAADDEITFDITVAGTGARGLKVWLIGTRG